MSPELREVAVVWQLSVQCASFTHSSRCRWTQPSNPQARHQDGRRGAGDDSGPRVGRSQRKRPRALPTACRAIVRARGRAGSQSRATCQPDRRQYGGAARGGRFDARELVLSLRVGARARSRSRTCARAMPCGAIGPVRQCRAPENEGVRRRDVSPFHASCARAGGSVMIRLPRRTWTRLRWTQSSLFPPSCCSASLGSRSLRPLLSVFPPSSWLRLSRCPQTRSQPRPSRSVTASTTLL